MFRDLQSEEYTLVKGACDVTPIDIADVSNAAVTMLRRIAGIRTAAHQIMAIYNNRSNMAQGRETVP